MPDTPKNLADHLALMQGEVYVAESLVSVIVSCGAMPHRRELVIQAAEAAQEILNHIGRGLDSVELSKVPQ